MRVRPDCQLIVVVEMTADEARKVAGLVAETFPLNSTDLLDAADRIERHAFEVWQ